MYQNTVYICISLYNKICWFPVKNCWCQLKGCVTWFIYFLGLLWVRYNCAKFHHRRICVTDFREGGLFAPPTHSPIHELSQKSPSWIGLRPHLFWKKFCTLFLRSFCFEEFLQWLVAFLQLENHSFGYLFMHKK